MPRRPDVHALCIGDAITHVDVGSQVATPRDIGDLPGLLHRLAAVLADRTGTVLLADDLHTAVDLPLELPRNRVQHHPALDIAREQGWRISEIGPWMTFIRHDSVIHVGILPWLQERNFPFFSSDREMMTARLRRYRLFVGVPYHGSHGGLSGLSLMRDHHKGEMPMWRPRNWDAIPPASQVTEQAPMWRRPHGEPWEIGADVNVQHLAAAGNALLSLGELQHTNGGKVAKRNPAGYYYITIPPWNLSHLMMHPAGPDAVPGTGKWVTSATLDLLWDLAEDWQVIDLPVVHESWTGERSGRVLRGWSEQLRNAIKAADNLNDPVLVDAIKAAYRAGRGMLMRDTSRVHRPDWADTIVGLARCNLWRRCWQLGQTGQPWPVAIEADAVWWARPTPERWWPDGLPQRSGPGGWKPLGARETPGEPS